MRILGGLLLAAAAGDAWNRAKSLRARDGARRDRRRLDADDAKDCAGKLPRAAERFKTRLAAATAGCQVVVYTTVFYPPGVRLPHPSTRLGPAAYNGSAGECYVIVANAASAASLREHCDVAPWRIVEMRGQKGVLRVHDEAGPPTPKRRDAPPLPRRCMLLGRQPLAEPHDRVDPGNDIRATGTGWCPD